MTHLARAPALLLILAACGGGSKSAPAPAPAPAPAAVPAAPSEATCDDACTDFAMCHEEVYGGDFWGGGECIDRCEEAHETFLACIAAAAADCNATLKCY